MEFSGTFCRSKETIERELSIYVSFDETYNETKEKEVLKAIAEITEGFCFNGEINDIKIDTHYSCVEAKVKENISVLYSDEYGSEITNEEDLLNVEAFELYLNKSLKKENLDIDTCVSIDW